MEYGLAIAPLNGSHLKKLESCQNDCIRRIFGASPRSSTKVMLHMTRQPSMKNRAIILQAKYLVRSVELPGDTLLSMLLPHLKTSASRSQWYKLTTNPLWQNCAPVLEDLTRNKFKRLQCDFLQKAHEDLCNEPNTKLLAACRPYIFLDPTLWLPMARIDRSRVLRWRFGWLPGGIPRPCIYHPTENFTRAHAIVCLHMHARLQMPQTVEDPLSFLLNRLPTKRLPNPNTASPWTLRWPMICRILHEMDFLFHDQLSLEPPPDIGTAFTKWLLSQKC